MQDPPHINSIGMEFVLIPAGTFQMGCSRHEVNISRPFYLGKYEVTQAQWEAVMGINPSYFKGENRPVDSVSWDDIQKFIEKLNAKEGHNRYRLPTEAEWEYAARAGSGTAYSFGDDAGQLGNYAWYRDNSGDETHPVGRKRPNAWGLYDMHGNVWEWVHDWWGGWGEECHSAGAVTDPQGPEAGAYRLLRGCGWFNDASGFRSADRDHCRPDGCYICGGFRLALSVEE